MKKRVVVKNDSDRNADLGAAQQRETLPVESKERQPATVQRATNHAKAIGSASLSETVERSATSSRKTTARRASLGVGSRGQIPDERQSTNDGSVSKVDAPRRVGSSQSVARRVDQGDVAMVKSESGRSKPELEDMAAAPSGKRRAIGARVSSTIAAGAPQPTRRRVTVESGPAASVNNKKIRKQVVKDETLTDTPRRAARTASTKTVDETNTHIAHVSVDFTASPAVHSDDAERRWARRMYSSAWVGGVLTGMFGCWGAFVAPLLLWLMKARSMRLATAHAVGVMNFAMTLVLANAAILFVTALIVPVAVPFVIIAASPMSLVIWTIAMLRSGARARAGDGPHFPLSISFVPNRAVTAPAVVTQVQRR